MARFIALPAVNRWINLETVTDVIRISSYLPQQNEVVRVVVIGDSPGNWLDLTLEAAAPLLRYLEGENW